jgi:hypothetical protein
MVREPSPPGLPSLLLMPLAGIFLVVGGAT